MDYYPPKISRRFSQPENAGRAQSANAVGTNATFVCGCALRFTLQISGKRIIEAKFQTNGCGFTAAAADIATEIVAEKELGELEGLKDLEKRIEIELGNFPPSRIHCLRLVVETLHAAFSDFRSARLEEFAGEKALICTCFGVSEVTIENLVAENRCETVEEVSRLCNAGSGCGSCQPLIQEIIDSTVDML